MCAHRVQCGKWKGVGTKLVHQPMERRVGIGGGTKAKEWVVVNACMSQMYY